MRTNQKKFMFVYRTPAVQEASPPSPQELEQVLAAWGRWKERFPEILDMGDALLPTGRRLNASGVISDGPTVESKELVSGYSIVAAASYEAACEVARACPILFMPGASVEVRELAGH